MPKITPFLWFDDQAEAAANLYVSLFPNSRITGETRYGAAGPGPAGQVMTVEFDLDGQSFIALNGGPYFQFSEAVSFDVACQDQAEIDRYWDALIADGGKPSQCGWLKDRFGLSWQITPKILGKLLADPDREKANRANAAMLKMVKLDIAELQRAFEGV
jgi:predicted 3-demethylubiquinone-9 3-methyltransferase (glyoxalase superfamily)